MSALVAAVSFIILLALIWRGLLVDFLANPIYYLCQLILIGLYIVLACILFLRVFINFLDDVLYFLYLITSLFAREDNE